MASALNPWATSQGLQFYFSVMFLQYCLVIAYEFSSDAAEMTEGGLMRGFLPSRMHRAGGIPRPLDGAQTLTTTSGFVKGVLRNTCARSSLNFQRTAASL